MPRQEKNMKPLIYVFCEGESEQAYIRFMKKAFSDAAVLKCVPQTGLFTEAKAKFQKDAKYKNYVSETDEIWFFFDVEDCDLEKWDHRYAIMKSLRKLRKKPSINIRLLMTSACIEYWLLLHFKLLSPSLHTVADKDNMMQELRKHIPAYQKGDVLSIMEIAAKYKTAMQHGNQLLSLLEQDGLPSRNDLDERYRWLYQCSRTFTNVHEAIEFLEHYRKANNQ